MQLLAAGFTSHVFFPSQLKACITHYRQKQTEETAISQLFSAGPLLPSLIGMRQHPKASKQSGGAVAGRDGHTDHATHPQH